MKPITAEWIVKAEVEFASLDGHTAAVVTLEANRVRSVSRCDIAHARTISAGPKEPRAGEPA